MASTPITKLPPSRIQASVRHCRQTCIVPFLFVKYKVCCFHLNELSILSDNLWHCKTFIPQHRDCSTGEPRHSPVCLVVQSLQKCPQQMLQGPYISATENTQPQEKICNTCLSTLWQPRTGRWLPNRQRSRLQWRQLQERNCPPAEQRQFELSTRPGQSRIHYSSSAREFLCAQCS
jgi:hypothetical protein